MIKRPSDQQFIDFLYEELSSEEMEKMANYLAAHPKVREEINEIKRTRGILSELPDEEILEPNFRDFTVQDIREQPTKRMPPNVWLITSIAASLLLLLIAGYVTRLNLSYSEEGFRLGFGQFEQPTSENLTVDDIQKIVDARIAGQQEDWNKKWQAFESNLSEQLAHNIGLQREQINRLAKAEKSISDDQILSFVDQLKHENKIQLASFYEATARDQEAYMKQVLNEFFEYLHDQREEDLRLIQANMLEIKSATDERQQETDKILASIITTVYNQNSAGR
jgi:hypothetical protein